jgi:hypothetical protein
MASGSVENAHLLTSISYDRGPTMINRDIEFRQLLRAYRAGIINEAAFECEMAAKANENGNGHGQSDREFSAMGKTFTTNAWRLAPC